MLASLPAGFDDALACEPMPAPPKWLKEPTDLADTDPVRRATIDRSKLKDFC